MRQALPAPHPIAYQPDNQRGRHGIDPEGTQPDQQGCQPLPHAHHRRPRALPDGNNAPGTRLSWRWWRGTYRLQTDSDSVEGCLPFERVEVRLDTVDLPLNLGQLLLDVEGVV